jgi:hypothetical protein
MVGTPLEVSEELGSKIPLIRKRLLALIDDLLRIAEGVKEFFNATNKNA